MYFEREAADESMTMFVENAITWVSKKKENIIVGCHFDMFKSEKFQVKVFPPKELESNQNIDVYLVNAEESLTDQDIKQILSFVHKGGGLLVGGQCWFFNSRYPLWEYPGNR